MSERGMHTNSNPYVTDRPVGDDASFVGRRDVFRWIEDSLGSGHRVLVLHGQSKIGKTSLLLQLSNGLYAKYVPVVIDTRGAESEEFEHMLWRVMSDVSQAASVLGLALPTVSRERAEAGEDYIRDLVLPVARHVLGDRCLVICLDGLSHSSWREEPTASVLAYLSELTASEENLALIVAVRGHPETTTEADWPEQSLTRKIGELTEDETAALLVHPTLNALAYDHESIRRVYGLTAGHPFFTQLFGQVLYESRATAGWVRSHDIESAIDEVIERGDGEFERLWQQCSSAAQAILALLGHARGWRGTISHREVVDLLKHARIQAPPDLITTTLEELVSLGILRGLGSGSYRFALELFRQWLRRKTKPEDLYRADRRFRRITGSDVRARRTTTNLTAVVSWSLAVLLLGLVSFAWQSRNRSPAESVPILRLSSLTVQGTVSPEPTTVVGKVAAPAFTDIAYMSKAHPADKWEVWRMRSDGSDPQQLTRNDANDTSPCWSPDGKRISFVSDRDGNREIYAIKTDGSAQINLTTHPAEDASPAWSPDGSQIAFASYRDGSWEIYVMDADGENPVRLTDNDAADYSPFWSPDGAHIAFASRRDGNWEIYVMQSDGADQTRLTVEEETDFAPAWSPDGTWIAFETYRDGNMEIYLVSPDGSELKNLTNVSATDDHGPSWARSGEALVFFSNRDGGWDVFSMKADGTEKTNLTLSQSTDQAPAWSP